jgi:hypothetical protein
MHLRKQIPLTFVYPHSFASTLTSMLEVGRWTFDVRVRSSGPTSPL